MKILKRSLILLILLLVIIAVGGFIYLQSTRPVYDGTITLSGLTDEVEVYFDKYGVPHIYARNEQDAYFALGYVHAQDRLFQMELLRRVGSGRLSEILGKDLVPTDKLFRTLGINQFAEAHARKFLSGDTSAFQRAAHAYQQGLNEYIAKGKTPIEFSIIGIPKEPFTPADIYRIIGVMGFGFAEGFKVDPMLEKVRSELGDAYLSDLAVQTPKNGVLLKSYQGAKSRFGVDPMISSIQRALSTIPVPLWVGSNGWAIDGSHSASGEPILANDTHMGYAQPAVWYEAHIEYPGYRFYGHHAAGVPFGFLGNNDFCGWGLTMFENDDVDFFREAFNPQDSNQVRFGDAWENLVVRQETIHVKGGNDVTLTVRSSRHGPLFNASLDIKSGEPVAVWWALTHLTNQAVQAVYEINHARSFEQFERAASRISAPGLNVMYADTEGAIAWWAAAQLPVRPPHVISKFFLDGTSGKDEYQGYYDFSHNPHAINPPWGFVYTANNQPDTVDGVYCPGYYYPRSRAGRIYELLFNTGKNWTPEEVRDVQLDMVSPMHRDIAQSLADALSSGGNQYREIVDLLRNWDGNHRLSDIAPSVYYNLLAQTMYLAMADELGWEAYEAFNTSSLSKNSWEAIAANDQSPWWDDIRTEDKKETRADIVTKAMERSIALLKAKAGPSMADWQWSKIHLLKHRHALGAVALLDPYFSVGPFGAPGGSEVINNLHFSMDTTGVFMSDGGPALRKVTDFSDIENGTTVSPTGQSGNIMSPHYKDQAILYVNGEARKMMMNRDEIVATSRRLVLKP